MFSIKNLFFLTVLYVSAFQSWTANADLITLLTEIDQRFRSSERAISAQVLLEEGMPRIGPQLLLELSEISRDALIQSLKEAAIQAPQLKVNQGMAENLLKLQQLAKNCRGLCPITTHAGDSVAGLSEKEIETEVASLPTADSSLMPFREFHYKAYELQHSMIKSVLDNDLYNFKVAALYFGEGLHLTHETTFSLFSRGRSNRAYMVAAGQDQVLDLLQNLHFTEREIQYLKNRADFKNVPPAFFEYLRDFRFTGKVRGVRPGTIIFAQQPILEVIANPVEAQIVETLALPIINTMSNTATKTSRVVQSAQGRPVVEGGTRRGAQGVLAAWGALIGGASGTSNTHAARLADLPAFGSQNHASIMMFKNEEEAFSTYLKYFPETTLLVDTHQIEEGVKKAVRAAGKKLKGIRLDSTLPNKSKAETAQIVRTLLDQLGHPETPITYSDGLDEYQLEKLKDAPFQMTLVGTEIAAPSDSNGLNVVYKLTQIKDASGKIIDPVKQSTGKVSLPGQKQYFRFIGSDGKYTHDLMAEWGDPSPSGAVALIEELMENGQRILPRRSELESARHLKEQLDRMPEPLLKLEAQSGSYPILISENLQHRQENAVQANTPLKKKKIGIFFGSFDAVKKAKLLYGLDQILLLSTEDYSKALKKLSSESELYLIGGQDLFKTLSSWKSAKKLLLNSHWIVTSRRTENQIQLPTLGPNPPRIEILELDPVETVFHEVDAQQTFWKGNAQRPDGPLAVEGTSEITRNVGDLKKLSYIHPRIKAIASIDRHFPIELKDPEINPEFHPSADGSFPGFPPHAMDGVEGPVGPARIPEVEVFPKKRQLIIPDNRPEGDGLMSVPFDLNQYSDQILDPTIEIVIEKNGPQAYDVFRNPRTQEIYQRIQPKRVIVYGVATDFCVDAAVQRFLKAALAEVWVVTDAISGVFCELSKKKMQSWKENGVKLVTTDQVFELYPEFKKIRGTPTLFQSECKNLFGKGFRSLQQR